MMASTQTTEATALTSASPHSRSSEGVRLRRAFPEDAAALALVGAATFLEAFTWMLPGADIVAHCARHHSPEAYQRHLAQPDTRILLAEAQPGGAPVGYVMLSAPDLPTFPVQSTDLELKRIYLFSRFRAAHTTLEPSLAESLSLAAADLRPAHALMLGALAEARALGRTRLLLGTHASNLQAIAFYRKHGFVEAGTRTFQVGSQVCHDLLFARQL